MTRVVLFSYGPVIQSVRSLLADVGADLAAVVLPSNRSEDAVRDARSATASIETYVQPRRADIQPFADALRRLDAQLFLVWHYSMLIPAEVLRIPCCGTVNLHGGRLPDYRGGHVLQWAIVNGERETAMTLHYVDETIDTGPVIAEEPVSIRDDDDAETIAAALQEAGLMLLRAHWPELASGNAAARPQEPGAGHYWPLRTPADGVIDWTASPEQIRNLVRALVPPWPGATTRLGGREIAVDRVELVEGAGDPGTILAVDEGRVVIAAGEGAVALTAARRGGRSIEPASLPVRVGDRAGF